MRRSLFFLFCFITQFLFAQDTLYGTITVKKNRKLVKSMRVFNYPLVKSKEKEGLNTELFKYNERGDVFLHSNFYNNTNETYEYDSTGRLMTMSIYNTYLRTFDYKDTFAYDDNGRLVKKLRFSYNKFNVGRRDVSPPQGSGSQNYVPEGVVFSEEYKYDPAGKLIYKINKREMQFSYFTYVYDSAGNQVEERAVSVRRQDLNGKIKEDTLVVINSTAYDEYMNPVKYETKNTRGETLQASINKFDTKGHKVETQVFDGTFALRQKFLFTYDEFGNMVQQLYYDYRQVNGKSVQSTETKIKYVIEY